jgi:hypothetical protein
LLIKAAAIVLQAMAIVAAALVVVWQMGKQHRNSLELQRENAREELRLKIYMALEAGIAALVTAAVNAGEFGFLPMNLRLYLNQKDLGLNPQPVSTRAERLILLNSEVSKAHLRLVQILESWEVAVPGFDIFRTAFAVAAHNVDRAFTAAFKATIPFLPVEVSTPARVETVWLTIPDGKQVDELEGVIRPYQDALLEFAMYSHDFKVEAQNALLGSIFTHRVGKRKPLDPSVKVIATDPDSVRELTEYFKNETAWGRERKETEERVGSPTSRQ